MNEPITLIYTRTEKWLISKDSVDWRIWQDKLYWFMTSLSFDNIEQCADFLREDFHIPEQGKQSIIDTVTNDKNKTFELYIDTASEVKIVPLYYDLLNSGGEIIDWSNWNYFYTKKEDKYFLWVYIGGIAEQVREIILSDSQVQNWEEKGNTYVSELAAELQRGDSTAYAEAIAENRKTV